MGAFAAPLRRPQCSSPSNEDAQVGLRAALARLAEKRTGIYDFTKLYEAARRGEVNVDVADYVGPVEVVDITGKGTLLWGLPCFANGANRGRRFSAFDMARRTVPYSVLTFCRFWLGQYGTEEDQ